MVLSVPRFRGGSVLLLPPRPRASYVSSPFSQFARVGRVSVKRRARDPASPSPSGSVPHGYSPQAPSQEALAHLRWMLQKGELGQDFFLAGPPGPLRRRLAMWFAETMRSEVEHLQVTSYSDHVLTL